MRNRPHLGATKTSILLTLSLSFASMSSLAVAQAEPPEPTASALPDPIASFTFDDVETGFSSGTGDTAARAAVTGTAQFADSWDGSQAASLPGSSDFYMRVYKGETGTSSTLLSGLHEVTISYDVLAAGTGNVGWTFFGTNQAAAPSGGNEHYVGILDRGGSVVAERFFNGRPAGTGATASAPATGWKHVDLVLTEDSTKLYVNGELGGESTATTMPSLAQSLGDATTMIWIGRAQWGCSGSADTDCLGGGEYFAGLLDNYAIYDTALSAEQVKAANLPRDGIALQSMTIPEADAVWRDLTLPATGAFGTPITWTSSDPAHVTAEGVVTRPALGEPNVQVELTATLGEGDQALSRTFTLTVLSLSEPDPTITVPNVCRTENLSIWATYYTLTTNQAYWYPRRTCDGSTSGTWRNLGTPNQAESLYYEFQDTYLMDQVSVLPTANAPTSLDVLYRDAVTREWLPVPNPAVSPAVVMISTARLAVSRIRCFDASARCTARSTIFLSSSRDPVSERVSLLRSLKISPPSDSTPSRMSQRRPSSMRSCTKAIIHRLSSSSTVICSMSASALFESTDSVSISTL